MQRQWMLAAAAAFALAALPVAPAHAGEMRATFGSWGYHLSGTVVDQGTRYDIRDELELVPRRRRSLALEYDTPKGWWPDLALSYSQMGARGDHSETVTLPLPGTRTIVTDADFDNYELVARYPFSAGALRLSAGLAVQQLKGDLAIDDSDAAGVRRERYDETFPQLHLQARLPLPAFALVTTAQGVEHGGDRALEWRALLEARFLEPLQLEFGWQEKRYDIDLGEHALDTRVRGALVRVGLVYR